MILTKKHLDRRTMLKGMGVTMALPLLEAMVPARAARAQSASGRVRFIAIEVPHGSAGRTAYGIKSNMWAPAGLGRDFDLSQTILSPPTPFKDDLTIVSWANGLRMALRVARSLETRGVGARVLDLRWLAPLPLDDLLRAAGETGRVLVVDETRRTGGVSEGILAALVDAGFDGQAARVASKDSFVPLGDAANLVLLSEEEIEAAALALCSGVTL